MRRRTDWGTAGRTTQGQFEKLTGLSPYLPEPVSGVRLFSVPTVSHAHANPNIDAATHTHAVADAHL